MKLNSWRGIGSDGDVLLTPYVPEGITGYNDDNDERAEIIIFYKGKVKKGKVYPRTGHKGSDGEQMYSSTLSLTLALDGGG